MIGLQLPDTDRVFTLFLVHRSIVTHGFLLPLVAYLTVRQRASWLRMAAAGLARAVAVHLAFDLFPRQWYGYAQLHIPLVGRVDGTLSVLWLAGSMVVCAYLALRLLGTRRDLGLALVATAAGFLVAMRREAAWLLPLLVLGSSFFLATCLPNPLVSGSRAVRRWARAIGRA